MAAFFQATFDAWKNYRRFGTEEAYVGYSPVITVDAEKILADLPNAHFLHIVRNPWSAYADTKKRPVPMSLENYMTGWCICQYFARLIRGKFPGRMHIIRIEDVMMDSNQILGDFCRKIGLEPNASLSNPSWNGEKLDEVYPWGTLRNVSAETNLATANELSDKEKEEIRSYTWQYLDVFDYKGFLV